MNNIISKYGTFLIVPPLLAVIAFIALRFNVTTKADVTIIQTAQDEIVVYLPLEYQVGDTLRLESPEFGHLLLAVDSIALEPTAQRAACRGQLPTNNTLQRATISTGSRPLYSLLLPR